VRTRIAKVLVVGALVCAIGGHWAVLQSVAWVGMFVKFSQSDPLKPALVKTFNGKHPCKLCLLIATGKKSEKKQETPKASIKLDLFSWANSLAVSPAAFAHRTINAVPLICMLGDGPPKPPPRPILS
jgi:hypothetical protein